MFLRITTEKKYAKYILKRSQKLSNISCCPSPASVIPQSFPSDNSSTCFLKPFFNWNSTGCQDNFSVSLSLVKKDFQISDLNLSKILSLVFYPLWNWRTVYCLIFFYQSHAFKGSPLVCFLSRHFSTSLSITFSTFLLILWFYEHLSSVAELRLGCSKVIN